MTNLLNFKDHKPSIELSNNQQLWSMAEEIADFKQAA